MSPVAVTVICFVLYAVFYRVWGQGLGSKIYELNPDAPTPAHTCRDNVDFIPTNRFVLFGHHYCSIAGLAPMLGPAIAVIWGWAPALLWVVLGTILIGAVHDFSALILSVRHQGKGIGAVAETVITPRARGLFLALIFFLISMAMGVFVLVVAGLFSDVGNAATAHPEAVVPTFSLMGIAMLMGWLVYRRGMRLGPVTAVGFALMVFLTWWGLDHPVGGVSRETWMFVLLAYAAAASILPVWLLLQPRDYLNSLLLYLGLGSVFAGMFLLQPSFAAPALNPSPAGAPPIVPFLFIVIACGAVSGFHGLVSSGTTSKQLDKESDGCMIGYGGMVGESILGLAAVLACTAGFASAAEWNTYYASWGAASGLAAKLGAFISGTGLFVSQLGVPREFAEAFMSVIVVGFALTSIDSGARLLRYTFHEIGESLGIAMLSNRYVATLAGVISIGFFAFFKVDGKPAGLFLWALFGTTNQILAGMTLLAATVYLFRKRRPYLYTMLPMLLVLTVTLWAMGHNLIDYVRNSQWALTAVGVTILALALWVCVEAVIVMRALRRGTGEPVAEEQG
ncbi:MAG: carbon starvation protein A [Nitrospirota bacterium]|nr:carbon starvation protein A [Nitrospirota bacterium]